MAAARMENNNGGQNVGGQRGEESQGPALGQLRKTFVSFSLDEQVIRAELRWVLKMVDSGYSFKSAENIPQLLSLMDKESKIFPKMTLGRQKCGYYVTHALYPFHFEALIKRILEVPAYTLGVDGGSFKVRGLKKMIDIVIRWFYFSQYCLITSSGTGTSQGVRLLTSSWTFMRLDTSRLTCK